MFLLKILDDFRHTFVNSQFGRKKNEFRRLRSFIGGTDAWTHEDFRRRKKKKKEEIKKKRVDDHDGFGKLHL